MEKQERDRLKIPDELCIKNCLDAIRDRMHRQAFFQTLTKTVFYGLFLLVILFISARVIYLPFRMAHISILVILGVVVMGICLSFRHVKDLGAVARVVDRKMKLKERFSTAFELMHDETEMSAGLAEFAKFQIRDTANAVAMLDVKTVSPYRMPRLIKGFPVPLLLIASSFVIPRFYDVPPVLSPPQEKVVRKTIQSLENAQIDNPVLQKRLRETVKRLKATAELNTVEEELSALTREVRKRKLEQLAVNKATEATSRFSGTSIEQLASELEGIAQQSELSPALQNELAALFERMAENVFQGELSDSLEQIQRKLVTQKTLQDIVNALRQMERLHRLEQLEAQLTANRKELALTNIEMQRSRTADSGGTPGQDAGSAEVQGTLEQVTDGKTDVQRNSTNVEGKRDKITDENLSPLISNTTSARQIRGTQLTLTTQSTTDSKRFSRVFTGNKRLDTGHQPYQRFNDVVLNANREYANAIENKRIPVRYQKQIKAYLETITASKEK